MSNSADKQPLKKRSLSSYLSNVSSRKEELIKIAEKEKLREEEEKLEKEKLKKERLENERIEKERLEKERLENERLEKERLELEKLEGERLEKERIENERLAKERLKQEKLNIERIEKERLEKERLKQEKLERERIEREKNEKERLEKEKFSKEDEDKEKTNKQDLETMEQKEQESKESVGNTDTTKESLKTAASNSEPVPEIFTEHISHKINHVSTRNDNHIIKNDDEFEEEENTGSNQKSALERNIDLQLHNTKQHDPFSRNKLKSILTEPHKTQSEADILIEENLESVVVNNTPDEETNEIKDEFENFNEIDSEQETEEGSPVKIRRGKLIRGDKMNLSQTKLEENLMLANDSDSELSDIDDDMKSIGLSSSFLHGNSSPRKGSVLGQEKQVSTHELFPSSPIKKTVQAKDNTKNSYVAVSKHPKSKKGLYRDSGGRTKLQIACDKGKIEQVKKFLEEGEININDQDNAGNTPLHEAALNGHIDIVKLLVKEGANINVQSYDMFQDTPLIDASANGHLDVVSYLLKHNADPTITNAKGMTAYEAIEEDSDLDESDKELVDDIKKKLRESTKIWNEEHDSDMNRNALQSSRGRRSTPVSGRDNSSRSGTSSRHDSYGPSGTHRKTGHNRSSSNDRGTVQNEQIPFYWNDITTANGKNKLLHAAKDGNLAYVGQYLENGGRPDFKSFFEAVKFGHSEITSIFLAFGASINGCGKDGITPLMVAVGRDHLTTVNLLLEAGANVLAKDKSGYNALYYARNSILGLDSPEEIKLIEQATKNAGGSIEVQERVSPTAPQISNDTTSNRSTEQSTPEPLHNETEKIQSTKVNNNNDDDKEETEEKEEETEEKEEETEEKEEETEEKVEEEEEKEEEEEGIEEEDEDEDEDVIIPISRSSTSPLSSINQNYSRKRRTPDLESHRTPISSEGPDIHKEEEEHDIRHDDKRLKQDTFISDNDKDNIAEVVIVKKIHEESYEEREQRLRAEEEYRQRKIRNKKLKEQEMLHKMQEDERKRHEEKIKQRDEEVKKLEEAKKLEELEVLRHQQEDNLKMRLDIRSRYPLGLKIISQKLNDDQTDNNMSKFLPILMRVLSNDNEVKRYMLDLQLQILIGQEKYNEIISEMKDEDNCVIPITTEHEKEPLWNMTKFLFLYGGSYDNNTNELYEAIQKLDLETRLEFETTEYTKFAQLPMNWVCLDSLLSNYSDLNETITNLPITQIELPNNSNNNNSNSSNQTTSDHHGDGTITPTGYNRTITYGQWPNQLPIKLQRRHVVINLCHHYKRNGSSSDRTQRQQPVTTNLWD
mgnify:CR=1 FL=1